MQGTSLNKNLLALIIISIGIIIFIIINPPHSICDTEAATFNEKQSGIMYPKIIKNKKIYTFKNYKEQCQFSNSPGGCYNFFKTIQNTLVDINNTSNTCRKQLFENDILRGNLFESLKIIIFLSISKEDTSNINKFNWLQEYEISIFCALKKTLFKFSDENIFNEQIIKISSEINSSNNKDNTSQSYDIFKYSQKIELKDTIYSFKCK